MERLAPMTRASASAGVDLGSLRGLLVLSDIGSPLRARASHLLAVWRLTPIWRATDETRSRRRPGRRASPGPWALALR